MTLVRLAGALLFLAGLYLLARSLPGWFWGTVLGAALAGVGWRLVSTR